MASTAVPDPSTWGFGVSYALVYATLRRGTPEQVEEMRNNPVALCRPLGDNADGIMGAAALAGDWETLNWLIQNQFPCRAFGFVASRAVAGGNRGILAHLELRVRASPDQFDRERPVREAARRNMVPLLEWMIDRGWEWRGRGPLRCAAEAGATEAVQLLTALGLQPGGFAWVRGFTEAFRRREVAREVAMYSPGDGESSDSELE